MLQQYNTTPMALPAMDLFWGKPGSSRAEQLPEELIALAPPPWPSSRLASPELAGGLEAVVTAGTPAQLHLRRGL